MTKELTAKDIECFNELSRLGSVGADRKFPTWYMRKRKDEIFEKSSYISPVDFWSDYLEWSSKGVQLKLL